MPVKIDYNQLKERLKLASKELGFEALGITDLNLGEHPKQVLQWVESGYQGEMDWMAKNNHLRAHPDLLLPGTRRLLSARMNYRTQGDHDDHCLNDGRAGYVSLYARGRDYHKIMRKRLARLAKWLRSEVPQAKVRACVDSAPVLEKPIAARAGLGWLGKNTLLLTKEEGSFFFLGEILTDLPIPTDPPVEASSCGPCKACVEACPTGAILPSGKLDARLCIAYLTIEHKSDIPLELRPAIGNRIFGCDDCQLVCPWNRFAKNTELAAFKPKEAFVKGTLLNFWSWDEQEFLDKTVGMAIRRINYQQWRRNLAVALGNAPSTEDIRQALINGLADAGDMVRRHILWALSRHSLPGSRMKK